MTDTNIHSREDFSNAYGARDWTFYKGQVAECIALGNPGTILDLGAGLGLFVEACTRYGLKCIGLEGSGYAVDTAKKRYQLEVYQHHLSNRFPFEDNSFSVVVCNQTIEHVSHETAIFMLKESYRVLQRGGVTIINSPCRYDGVQRKEPSHINLYTPNNLKKDVLSAGFTGILPRNSPRFLLGENRFGTALVNIIFRFLPLDFFSSTANCIAYKL